jgi:hypothetical protein
MTDVPDPWPAATFGKRGLFRRPLYDSYCFSRLPDTIAYLFGQEDARTAALPAGVLAGLERRCDAVVLLFIDAFGWEFFERFAAGIPVLQEVQARGRAVRLTAQFPSTTAAHVTCIHTGLAVGQSGVYEWSYYDPGVGAVISPLIFSFAGEKARETLAAAGVSPDDVFPPGPTLYERLAAAGVESFVYQPDGYVYSTASNRLLRGRSGAFGYRTLPEGLTDLALHLLDRPAGSRRYYMLYADLIDHIGHRHGPNSPQFAAEVQATFAAVGNCLVEPTRGRVGNTLVLMIADHGQVPTDPATTVYLNEALPDLASCLRPGRDGRPIPFGGSPRDLFLYVREERMEELRERLQRLLEGRAEVYAVRELIAEEVFGRAVGRRFLERVGDLVVLPYAGETVYWREEGRFVMDKRGHHGGLTPQEMDTGLYLLPLHG